MKVLITGGAGFIGGNFVLRSLKRFPKVKITVLDTLTYASNWQTLEPVLEMITFVKGDVSDQKLVDSLVSQNDVIVHFAAESHNDNALSEPWPFVYTNVIGTITILQAVRLHGKHLHHISTDEVYGDLSLESHQRFDEFTAYFPSSPYSASKASSDHFVRSWCRSYGVNATISTSSNNYGPHQHVEKFIPRQITNLLDGQRPKLYGTGTNVRDWIHVNDHNDAVWNIIKRGQKGSTYLVGVDGELSNITIVRMLLEIFGLQLDDFDHVKDRAGHDRRYAVDATRLRTELGWTPRYAEFHVGLEETVAWYAANETWWRASKETTEARYSRTGHA